MAYVVQIIIQLPLRLFFKIFYRLEARGVKHLKGLKDPIIFISNHVTLSDPWLAGTSLPFASKFLRVHTIGGSRFNAPLKWFYSLGIIPFIYWVFGVVVLPKEGSREQKIQPIVDVLKKGKSVLIYPEGGRAAEEGHIREFRLGTAEMFLRTKVPIVPIGIEKIHSPRQGILLVFGESFIPISTNAEDITRELRAKVVELVQ